MGKTDTINDWRIDVYVDTVDRKRRWAELAEEEGKSLFFQYLPSTSIRPCPFPV